MFQVSPLLGGGVDPIASALLVRMDGVEVAEFLRAGCARDTLPLVIAVGSVAFLFGRKGRDDGIIFGAGRRRIDRLGPGDIAFMAVDAVGVGLGDARIRVGLGFGPDLQGLRRGEADEMFVDRLTSERQIAFELV